VITALPEIFVRQVYREAVRTGRDVKLIVDLGAYVGYSCIYFLQEYPRARFIAFEPPRIMSTD